jgi:hypothetical protein
MRSSADVAKNKLPVENNGKKLTAPVFVNVTLLMVTDELAEFAACAEVATAAELASNAVMTKVLFSNINYSF